MRYSVYHQVKALTVLFVFIFSLLPRQVVHNFVTNHQHIKYSADHGEDLLSSEIFNCNVDNVFVHQTYTTSGHFEISAPVKQYVSVAEMMPLILLPIDAHPDATRGPPSLI